MNVAPIVLFVYNRPWHTEQTLNALMQNELADQSELYIFADGPKLDATLEQKEKIIEVRKLVRSKKWCREVRIIESETNIGLANSIIYGVTEIVNRYEKIIVLEDDIIISKWFLRYMNDALTKYFGKCEICSITGYVEFPNKNVESDMFFATKGSSWGWGTWKDIWNKVNFDVDSLVVSFAEIPDLKKKFNYGGEDFYQMLLNQKSGIINSWAIRFYADCFLKGKLHVLPTKSLIINIGFDGSGTHCSNVDIKHTNFTTNFLPKKYPKNIAPDEFISEELKRNRKKPLSSNKKKTITRYLYQFFGR